MRVCVVLHAMNVEKVSIYLNEINLANGEIKRRKIEQKMPKVIYKIRNSGHLRYFSFIGRLVESSSDPTEILKNRTFSADKSFITPKKKYMQPMPQRC